MGSGCRCLGSLLPVLIIVFSFVNWYSKWIIVICAALLLITPHMDCKHCSGGKCDVEPVVKKTVKKKVKKKK